MQIGTDEHKQLFCATFVASHQPYDPREWAWPRLDDVSLARLRAIPIWTLALEVELGAGKMLGKFAKTESDPLARQALDLQGYEEDRHGRILQCMIERYGLRVSPNVPAQRPTRSAFIEFGYNECVDSLAGFGVFRLACDARVLPVALTSLFQRVIEEEARHIIFFVNWVAWDRVRRGLRGPMLQAIPALVSYAEAIVRRIKGGAKLQSEKRDAETADLFGDVVKDLTIAKFLRACLGENDRYMAAFDPRLIRPRVMPALLRMALGIVETIDRFRPARAKPAREAAR